MNGIEFEFILSAILIPRADNPVNFASEDEFLECPTNKNVEDMKYEGECFNNKAKKKIDSENPFNLASYSETQCDKVILWK